MKTKILGLLAVGLLSVAVSRVEAAVIAEFTSGTTPGGAFVVGQSFTAAAGNSFNNITFNFFSDISGGTTPSGAGGLFLLTQAYLGPANALGIATPGFLAQSTGVSGGVFSFDSSVMLLGGTQYFVFSTQAFALSGSNANSYAGGTAYLASNASSNFSAFIGDANFRVSGTAVPEPGTLALLGLGLLGLGVSRRKA